ncbi:MAG: type II toxin-antitoxin system PemK/MazF family toxin [Roseateles sp.]|uniref:type II toxin-antitoxin system PemK/MazF family toxin n=1 Tax=Roseateles sp. TaxID=1971397 RepID=UPI0039E87021
MAATARPAFGDVVLVPFPFTDQSGIKKRPAVVVSSAAYHARRRDLVILAVTSQVRTQRDLGNRWHSDQTVSTAKWGDELQLNPAASYRMSVSRCQK